MPLQPLNTGPASPDAGLLSPSEYDGDATSIRSEQDSDSDDDERQLRARNSRELRAHDRLVLMEEEETDQLVTETRRLRERERRGSGLPIPNPLRLISRRVSDSSSRSRSPVGLDTALPPASEKRTRRRARRKAKREVLMAEARDGEDGGLMYEMESGTMRDGSSTGDSSERENSDEVDRTGLLHLAHAKAKRGRNCRKWLFVYSVIAVAFALLMLAAWKVSIEQRKKSTSNQRLVSNGTALFAPTTIFISLDGFRADFLQRGLTPRLNALVREGVSPPYMLPSFPSVTFPNHYTLATGLYPESHGVVSNKFWDPELRSEFYYTDPERSMNPQWWTAEPFWVTAEEQGIRTAIHMWPGSEAHIPGAEPSFVDKYNGAEELPKKVDRILELLDKPGHEDRTAAAADTRPQIIAAYVPNVDADGHLYGPNSTEIRSTISRVDAMLDQLLDGLASRNLTHIVNVIIVSDHGMATTDTARVIQLEDLVDLSRIEHTDGWPLVGLRPKEPGELREIHAGLMEKAMGNPNIDVYLRDVDMPERWHFSNNERIAPLWIVPKTGWAIAKMKEMDVKAAQAEGQVYHPRGIHGYDNEHPLMRAIFIARGPAFPHPPNSQLGVFQNIEVYNILCDSVGLRPRPSNGTLRLPLDPVGIYESPGAGLEAPADPMKTSTSPAMPSGPASLPSPGLVGPASTTEEPPTTDPTPASSTSASSTAPPPPGRPDTSPTSGAGSGDETDGGDEDTDKDFWGWLKGELDTWWGKIKGGGP